MKFCHIFPGETIQVPGEAISEPRTRSGALTGDSVQRGTTWTYN